MCTLTWLFNSDRRGYTLLFNRDELKTRKRAYPPSLTEAINGVSYLAPIDADAGGTWLAVNQYGLTICLLNYYAVESKNSDAIHSRGEVVTQLASCQSIAGIEAALRKMTLENYNGFEIVALHDDIAHWRWDTCQLQKIDAKAPITSSSYNTKAVQESRQEFFNSLDAPNTIDALKAFHSCHLSDNSQVIQEPLTEISKAVNSVCVHREFSQTVSQSLVMVDTQKVSITYTDGSPCTTLANETVYLERRRAVA